MKVHLFFRKPESGYRSIEEVFGIVLNMMQEPKCIPLEVPEKRITPGGLWKNLSFAWKNRGKVNHITGDVHYLALATGPRTVLTIHDAYSVITGNRLRRFLVKLFWFWIPGLLVKQITTISEKSRSEIAIVMPFVKRKITVIPNPYNPALLRNDFHIKEELITNTAKPIVLHLGTKSNKNLERTIEAMEGLPYKLYIIGKLSDQQATLLAKYRIDFRSYFNLPYSEVAMLYHQCTVVCFASLYEGFGMPIIEGQLVGKPVLTSNIDPMPWVAGQGGAYLVDPFNVNEIRAGLLRIVGDDDYRKSLVTAGLENIKRFDPEIIAGMYAAVYKEIAEN